MKLTIIGCSGSYPGPESPASCYLAEAEADGTVVNLRNKVGIDPNADPDTAVLAMLLAA